MVTGLRGTDTSAKASDHLGRLDLGRRAASLVAQAVKEGAAEIVSEEDLTASAIAKQKRALATAGYEVAEQGGKVAVGTAKGVGKVVKKTAAMAFRGIRGARRGGGASATGLGSRKLGTPVRSGVVAASRRRAAAKGAATAGKTAAVAQVRSTRAAAQATREAIRAATFIGRLVASLIASLSSTPTLIVTVSIAAVLAIVLSFLAFVPSIAKQAQDQGADITLSTGAFPIVDDYPYKGMGDDSMNPESGYYFGNCTDFVWWRINRDAGVVRQPWKLRWAELTPEGGNGGQWANPGNLPGWTDTRAPVPGDVISIHHGGTLGASADDPGHVGYIAAVDGSGAVTIENYGNGNYFITKTTVSEINTFIDNGWVGVKHNPAGRVGGVADGDANGDAKAFAKTQVTDEQQFQCLDILWMGESNWNPLAENSESGAYGIPQALPGNKMASSGDDWQTNPITQVKWGLDYIRGKYGTPCDALFQWQFRQPHWY